MVGRSLLVGGAVTVLWLALFYLRDGWEAQGGSVVMFLSGTIHSFFERNTKVSATPQRHPAHISRTTRAIIEAKEHQLLVAASSGHVLALRKLLNGGADTNTADERGMTLYRVSDNGNADTVEILLKEGGGAASASGTRKGARLCTPPAPMTTMP